MSDTAYTPRFYLRHALALKVLKRQPRVPLVEFGCGSGRLLLDLARLGFSPVGVEPSTSAAERARTATADIPSIRILTDPNKPPETRFRIGVALEVLEHVEDDAETLRTWTDWLETDAIFIASVPAHMRLWSAGDDVAGHVRRYERSELEDLFRKAGYRVLSCWSYGYPLTAVTRRLRDRHAAAVAPGREGRSALERTFESAAISEMRSRVAIGYSVIGRLGHWAQLPFLNTGWGDGFMVVAQRR